MIKAVLLTSEKSRHAYLCKKISENFRLVGLIIESKGDYYKKKIDKSELLKEHFIQLNQYELKYFPDYNLPDVPKLNVLKGEINSFDIFIWTKKLKPDLIFLFGTSILKDHWIKYFKNKIINLHLGLSPFYRGSATLFWPIYEKKLRYLGSTIHLADKKVDAGKILKYVKPKLSHFDNYYDINYKIIKTSIDSISSIAKSFILGRITPIDQNLSKGKIYKKDDFNEKCLKEVLIFLSNGLTEKQIKEIENENII